MANLAEQALDQLIARLGSQKAAAKHLGVSQAYVNDLAKRRRPMSAKILGKLGYKRVVVTK